MHSAWRCGDLPESWGIHVPSLSKPTRYRNLGDRDYCVECLRQIVYAVYPHPYGHQHYGGFRWARAYEIIEWP